MVTQTRLTSARVWWVNQGGTYADERSAGYVFATQRSANGRAIAHHETVTQLHQDDAILHYSHGHVRALSRVVEPYRIERRPIARRGFDSDHSGYLVQVTYHDAQGPIALGEIPMDWRTDEPQTGPFDRAGNVKQGYLFELSERLAAHIFSRFASRLPAMAMATGEEGRGPVAGTGAPEEQGFGLPYRPAGDRDDAEEQLPHRVVDLAELDRATRRHMELQDRLASELRRRGIVPRSPEIWQPQFDLAFEHDGQRWVIEVKTSDPVSAQQVRLGLGQVLEYRHRLSCPGAPCVVAALLLETTPADPWSAICQDLGVVLVAADRLHEALSQLASGDGRGPG